MRRKRDCSTHLNHALLIRTNALLIGTCQVQCILHFSSSRLVVPRPLSVHCVQSCAMCATSVMCTRSAICARCAHLCETYCMNESVSSQMFAQKPFLGNENFTHTELHTALKFLCCHIYAATPDLVSTSDSSGDDEKYRATSLPASGPTTSPAV